MVVATADGVLVGLLLGIVLPVGSLIGAGWTVARGPWPLVARIVVALFCVAVGFAPIVLLVVSFSDFAPN